MIGVMDYMIHKVIKLLISYKPITWRSIDGVIIRVTILIPHIGGLTTLLRTTHEPPSWVLYNLLTNSHDAPNRAF